MVMDIRHLRDEAGHGRDRPLEEAVAPVAAAQPAAPCEPEIDLEELVTLLAQGDNGKQVQAAEQLRVLVPNDVGIDRLCAIIEDTTDPRRLPALQILGFHRRWLSSRSQLERVLVWARVEEDPEAATAIAWLLRGREVLQELLLHPVASVSREAALGLPVGEATLATMLDALLVGRGPDIDRILTQRLTSMHPSLTGRAVDHILLGGDHVTDAALSHVLAHLPQQQLFELLVEGSSRPPWTAEHCAQDNQRLQRWHHVARLASGALLHAPSGELIRYLVNRSASDDMFARRQAVFVKAAMDNTRDVIGPEMLDDLERLTSNATDDRLERMARMLLDLSDKIAGGETHSHVADLLEKWKSRSPALKLKIFHLQQGLK